MGIPQLFETLGADLKFAARSLRKNPFFLTVVVLSLASASPPTARFSA